MWKILKEKYNINENDSLIFIKNEKKNSKASEKEINFDVYEPYNKTKLNLSFCEGSPINIIIPTELSEETKQLYDKMKDSGYDMFKINDPFIKIFVYLLILMMVLIFYFQIELIIYIITMILNVNQIVNYLFIL